MVGVEDGQASIRSAAVAAAVAFGAPGEVGVGVQLQGIAAEGSTGIRCWHWEKTPRLGEGVVERSTVVGGVVGDKVALEVVREGALEGEEVAAVEAVAAVVDVVATTYTARASDHTAQNSHMRRPEQNLRYSVAEAGQGGNTQNSTASSWVDISADSHTGTIQKAAVYHAQPDRKAQESTSKACSGHRAP